MAQSGYTPISLYYSTTAAATPSSGNLTDGELAINITDGILYYKNSSGTVVPLSSSSGGITWQSVQSANFTATAGNAYPINTTSAAITVTLPASPTSGQLIGLLDYAGTFATNNVVVNPNGNNLNGATSSVKLDQNNEGITFVYSGATQGWVSYSSYKAITPPSAFSVNYLIVAGGGGGGATSSAVSNNGGGGGAGGLISGSGVSVDKTATYTVTVGSGGAGAAASAYSGVQGSNSSFSAVGTAAVGGGYGNGQNFGTAGSGGSGGGSYRGNSTAGSGTTGQGNAGSIGREGSGNAGSGDGYNSGGGGGAGGTGTSGSASVGGAGGVGVASSISGTSTYYAGGGGGGVDNYRCPSGSGGAGGNGGGGAGANSAAGTAGTANTGGGGGGSSANSGGASYAGGNGGSGTVIVSYADTVQQMAGGSVTSSGGNIIHTFNSSGYLTPLTYVGNSLRTRASASAYLSRTPASNLSRQIFTYSAWVKRGALGSFSNLLSTFPSGTIESTIAFTSSDTLQVSDYNSADNILLVTSQVFRDPAAWYHIVVAFDTTQATSTNRVKIYVNGSQVTAFGTSIYPTQNYNMNFLQTGSASAINARGRTFVQNFDGEITNLQLIDGQQLTPNSFGSFNLYGVWQPISYGGTYGTNGFYLPFSNTTSTTTLGYDTSGNSNNWTCNNISLTAGSTYDAMTDSPTLTSETAANYAVPNPLDFQAYSSSGTSWTISNANLRLATNTNSGANSQGVSMYLPSSGLFYGEITLNTVTTADAAFVWIYTKCTNGNIGYCVAYSSANPWGSYGYYNSYTATGTATSAVSNGAVLMWAIDASTRKVWMGINGTWFNSGNPAAGTGQIGTHTGTDAIYFAFGGRSSNTTSDILDVNFGQQPFAYTAPSGYLALNTYNM